MTLVRRLGLFIIDMGDTALLVGLYLKQDICMLAIPTMYHAVEGAALFGESFF